VEFISESKSKELYEQRESIISIINLVCSHFVGSDAKRRSEPDSLVTTSTSIASFPRQSLKIALTYLDTTKQQQAARPLVIRLPLSAPIEDLTVAAFCRMMQEEVSRAAAHFPVDISNVDDTQFSVWSNETNAWINMVDMKFLFQSPTVGANNVCLKVKSF
jgi:hypothetical protein